MSSEEDDYMSQTFLTECIKDVRPGLIKNRAKEKQIEVTKKKLKIIKKQREESTKNKYSNRLQEGLSQPLTSDNKGFTLLAKMGYKHGESLGKKNTGIVEPIEISIKCNRSGFGREAALQGLVKRKEEIINKRKINKKNSLEQTTEEFRKRICLKAEEKFFESALRKCQSACEKLDEKDNIVKPVMEWFWRKILDEEFQCNEDDETAENTVIKEDDQYSSAEKLEMITYYLRTTYYYCHWCGIQYQNTEDLNKNCPGLSKNDH